MNNKFSVINCQIHSIALRYLNTSNKIVQDFKCRMFNIELEQYEVNIQQYEDQFEQEFTAFQLETFRTSVLYQMT